MSLVKTSFRIAREQLDKLRELSRRSRVPQTVILRDLLTDALVEWELSRWPEERSTRWTSEEEE